MRIFLSYSSSGLIAAVVVVVQLWNPAQDDGWQPVIEARDFLTRHVYRDEVVERTEYALDHTYNIVGSADSLVRVTRVAYGSISDTAAAMSITLRFRNVTPEPLKMDFNHRFFRLEDDQGRTAELLYFCCNTGSELLAPNGERERQLIFAANPDWTGKEIQARRINFHVDGLLPLTRGIWWVPALATAARATVPAIPSTTPVVAP